MLSSKNYQCQMSYQAPVEKVYQTITNQGALIHWWAQECTVNSAKIGVGSELTFHFGKTFTVMKIKEVVPNKKVVWECIKHYHVDPNLSKTDEWVGTQIIFQLKENPQGGTNLQFVQEGLMPSLECFSHCEDRWNFFLKESLRDYLEKGVGKPYRG